MSMPLARLGRAGWWIAAVLIAAGLLLWQQQQLQNRIADDRLDSAHAIQTLIEQQLIADLRTRAELIAGNQAFIGYLTQASGGILPGTVIDNASIVDLVEERRLQLGLAIAAVISEQGKLIASPDSADELAGFSGQKLFKNAIGRDTPSHGLWLNGKRAYYVALLPLAPYGSDAGFLLVGEPIGDSMAKRLSTTTHTQIALFPTAAQAALAASSTLASAPTRALIDGVRNPEARGEQRYTIRLDGAMYRGYTAPLFGSDSVQLASLVKTSTSWASRLQLGLPMIVALLVFFAAAMLSRASTPATTRQEIDNLARIMERAAEAGDFHLQAPETEGRLTTPVAIAFNRLMARLRNGKSG